MINRIARLNDMYEMPAEVEKIRNSGYSGEQDWIYYDYVYKWARMLHLCEQLGLQGPSKTFLELGGGLAPIQFFLAQNGSKVVNLDQEFDRAWFPTDGKYYTRASYEFICKSEEAMKNITFIQGNIFETIKTVPTASIDAVIDTCAFHIFIGDGTNGLLEEIARVLKPGGYLISIGDVANPHLGKCDAEFQYPEEMAKALTKCPLLKLVEPYDYKTWEPELMNRDNIIPRRNVDYNDLSLINMKCDPASIPYGNIPTYPIHIWTATYVLQRSTDVL